MSTIKRNTFSGGQKAKVALAAIKGLKTVNEIAQEYGVHPTQVNQWKKDLLVSASSVFDGKRGPKPAATELNQDRLYAKIGQLNMELDWLKKSPGSTCNRTHALGGGGRQAGALQAMHPARSYPIGDL